MTVIDDLRGGGMIVPLALGFDELGTSIVCWPLLLGIEVTLPEGNETDDVLCEEDKVVFVLVFVSSSLDTRSITSLLLVAIRFSPPSPVLRVVLFGSTLPLMIQHPCVRSTICSIYCLDGTTKRVRSSSFGCFSFYLLLKFARRPQAQKTEQKVFIFPTNLLAILVCN